MESRQSAEAGFFEVMYWISMIAMSLFLGAITIAIFVSGVKFIKGSRKFLGYGCMVFSVIAAYMIFLMVDRQFF